MKKAIPLLVLSLAACGGLKDTAFTGSNPAPSARAYQSAELRLATEAQAAIHAGKVEEALAKYEKLYADPAQRNSIVVLNYAQLLRRKGEPQKAIDLLIPWVETAPGEVHPEAEPVLVNEMAASVIESGNFTRAENLLRFVLENENDKTFHADAHNLQGIIFGARKDPAMAEEHFRLALEGWRGDATSVKNNLAVCLASQGRFDESLSLLRQALIDSPEKAEIAKNIELVTRLRANLGATTTP